MKISTAGYAVLALAVVLSSLPPLAYKVGSNMDAITLAFVVSIVGVAGSLAVMLAKGTQHYLHEYFSKPRNLFSFAFVGASFAALTLIFSYTSHYISASLLAVVYRSWPLMFILVAPFMLKERIIKYDIAAVLIGFSGMAFALLGGTTLSLPYSLLPYALMVLLAAVIDAFTVTFQKGYKYEMTSTLFMYNLFSLVTLFIFMLLPGAHWTMPAGATDIGVILFLGIVQNVVLTFLFTAALRMNRSSLVANAVLVVPFLTILFDFALLGEALQLSSVLIAVSVVAGLAIQKAAPKSANYVSSDQATSGPAIYDVTSAFISTRNRAIYEVIKGRGRALAFYITKKDKGSTGRFLKTVEKASRNPALQCMILTNKMASARKHRREFEFIRELIGHDEDDVVVLCIGEPKEVVKTLHALYDKAPK